MTIVSRLAGAGALSALMLMFFAPVAAEDKILTITPKTKSILDDYLKRPHPLALAVSPDGTRAGYVYCSGSNCNVNMPINQREAINYCGQDCIIFAVGREIKLPYEVVEPPPATVADLPLCKPGSLGADFPDGMPDVRLRTDACNDFRGYMAEGHFKAFAIADIASPDIRWGWGSRYRTAKEAIDVALSYCRSGKPKSECRLYAVGNIVVYDLPDAAQQAAIDAYGKDRETLNADLPPG